MRQAKFARKRAVAGSELEQSDTGSPYEGLEPSASRRPRTDPLVALIPEIRFLRFSDKILITIKNRLATLLCTLFLTYKYIFHYHR